MMDGIAERHADARTDEVRGNFITSHRAAAVCARELARLHDAIADGLAAWGVGTARAGDDASLADAPVVRRTPGRCLVQVGPVALTVAWLQRAQGTVADGELLVMVWRGAVAVQTPRGFERTGDRAGASSATPLWERVLVVAAESEKEWAWVPTGVVDVTLSSSALADQCIERLRAAHAECARAR
ncbi:MAG TPA: hypothetical protein VF461_02885 [Gemmatimonadaceae bacterium]